MILGAFVDLGFDPTLLKEVPARLNLPQVEVTVDRIAKKGISAVTVDVHYKDQKKHRHLPDIERIIDAGDLPAKVKMLSKDMFRALAEAEARVHGIDVNRVHFHEVGALDAIVDITGAALAFHEMQFEKAFCGTIRVGSGFVHIAHGTYPVPAPATAYLLEGFTIQNGPVEKELVTPTGAAVLSVLVGKEKQAHPAYRVKKVGYGAGKTDMERIPNVLRLISAEIPHEFETDEKMVLECNMDDMDPQIFPFLIEEVMNAGAVDAYVTPVIMKKGRPGHLFTAVCSVAEENRVLQALFRHSTTIGVRKIHTQRSKLKRNLTRMQTSLGEVQIKEIEMPDGSLRRTVEFEECKRIAREKELSIRDVQARLNAEINYGKNGENYTA